ncbi:MAG: sulfite exporter TauE/SafE family protein [Pseudomonadota bacterium]
MDIYLPIAEVSLNLFVILGLGAGIGFLSGMCGVGGGFMLTPLLIQIGVPPPVAVASAANQVAGASVSGFLGHLKRATVDMKMGWVLLGGGLAGSSLGVLLFRLLREWGQVDLVVALCYVILLGALGTMMMIESVGAIFKRNKGAAKGRGARRHSWMHRLPLKMRFRKSKLYISALVPAGIGFGVGVLSALMGVGGGFIVVPAMIYILGMPTAVVVGTSLFQIMFTSAYVTFLQAWTNQSVDIALATLMLFGGVVGAQLGTRLGAKLPAEYLRALLALLILAVSVKVLLDLTVPPVDVYSRGIVPS